MSGIGELLGRVMPILESVGIPYMIAGSVASTAHGVPRTTLDVDVVIAPPDVLAMNALLARLHADAYYVDPEAAREAFRRSSMFNVVDHATGCSSRSTDPWVSARSGRGCP